MFKLTCPFFHPAQCVLSLTLHIQYKCGYGRVRQPGTSSICDSKGVGCDL